MLGHKLVFARPLSTWHRGTGETPLPQTHFWIGSNRRTRQDRQDAKDAKDAKKKK
jgi:hypothetical protein